MQELLLKGIDRAEDLIEDSSKGTLKMYSVDAVGAESKGGKFSKVSNEWIKLFSPLILHSTFPVYNREEHVRPRWHHHRHQVLRHLPHGRPLRHGRHADARAVPSGAGTRDRRSGDASENHAGSRNLVIFSRMHLLCIYLRSGKMSRISRLATTRASAPSSTPASNASKIEDVGAPVECQVGQNFDKFWTNVQVLSNICPTFVQVLSMSNICQNNWNFTKFCQKFVKILSKNYVICPKIVKEISLCPIRPKRPSASQFEDDAVTYLLKPPCLSESQSVTHRPRCW